MVLSFVTVSARLRGECRSSCTAAAAAVDAHGIAGWARAERVEDLGVQVGKEENSDHRSGMLAAEASCHPGSATWHELAGKATNTPKRAAGRGGRRMDGRRPLKLSL